MLPEFLGKHTMSHPTQQAFLESILQLHRNLLWIETNSLYSWYSGINPLIGFDPSIFELSTFFRGKGKSE